MLTQSQVSRKDGWDKSQIVVQAVLALIALAFTILFNLKQQENAEATLKLTNSNLELAKSQNKISEGQLKSGLLPSLSSENPHQRAMAMYLARALDEEFAAAVAGVLSISDPDANVRKSARTTLGSLSQSQEGGIRQRAERSIIQYDIVNEMRSKGILKTLSDAQGYLEGGNLQDKEKALQIYVKVVTQLSPAALKNLNQKLLSEAKKDYQDGYSDEAISKFKAVFNDYWKASSVK